MTYNHAPRRRFTAKQREAFLIAHDRICYWCGGRIESDQPWDIEHRTAREMLPDASADADENLAPIHAHPKPCHKIKSRLDKAMIAKSNRIRRSNGPAEDRRKTKHPIRSRKAQWPKRSFPKRGTQ